MRPLHGMYGMVSYDGHTPTMKHMMSYRHEIEDSQGWMLIWEMTAKLSKQSALSDMKTKCGDQIFIWPNVEQNRGGQSDTFDTFYSDESVLFWIRMDNYR